MLFILNYKVATIRIYLKNILLETKIYVCICTQKEILTSTLLVLRLNQRIRALWPTYSWLFELLPPRHLWLQRQVLWAACLIKLWGKHVLLLVHSLYRRLNACQIMTDCRLKVNLLYILDNPWMSLQPVTLNV